MRWLDQVVLPVGTLALTTLGARLAHAELGRRRLGHRTAFWRRVALEAGLTLGLLSLISSWLEPLLPTLWQRGWHAHFDLVPGQLSLRLGYLAALALPVAVWGALVVVGLILADRARGRWTGRQRAAGPAESGRLWVLAAALPLAAALLAGWPRLGGGPGAYPAFTWATLAVALVSLLAAALTTSPEGPVTAAKPAAERTDDPPRVPWPQALRNHGLDLATMARWPASKPRREHGEVARSETTTDLGARLARSGARQVPRELIETVETLLTGARGAGRHGRALLVFGAEDDGRLETVAAAAGSMAQRFLRRTLVICPHGASGLAAELKRFLPAGSPEIQAFDRPGEIDRSKLIWVATAEACSESLLFQLASNELAPGLGLVVWWDLHRFSGVPAANLWAVSHRLYRLLARFGSGDVRTLALAWRSRHPGAQVERYVHRLLPHAEADRREILLEPSWRQPTELHLLGSTERFFKLEPTVLADRTHPLVAAAKASLDAAWPTHLDLPPAAASAMTLPLERVRASERRLGEALSAQPAAAAARLLTIEPWDVLALPERISELGRATSESDPHHVGVMTTGNPYVEYLLHTLAEQPAALPTASRRMVAAVGQPRILHRHLLRALAELPDTGANLRRDFLAYEGAVEQTLAELHAKNELARSEIRTLGPDRKLCRDFKYHSFSPPDRRYVPFDSVGGELIDVRDSAAAQDHRGVVLSVDSERLLIKAYPHRVFTHGGRRYQVREWLSIDEALRRGFVECELEANPVSSLRLRRHTLQAVRPEGNRVNLGRPERGLARQLAHLTYEEWVDGALHWSRDPAGRIQSRSLLLERALPLRLATSALRLFFPDDASRPALEAIAQAFRSILPVHLGVDEDDLEVVAFGGMAGEQGPRGIALVELYSGGFGLLEPVAEDLDFLFDLLARIRAWLNSCPCRSTEGCERCLRSISALACNAGLRRSRAAALETLARVLG